MNYLNIQIATLRRPEFTAAEPMALGVWLRLSCYCAAQENGGRIMDCKAWTDRQWLIACGITLADLQGDTKLWKWDMSNGLVVFGYPLSQEREVKLKREAGKRTAKARWARKIQPKFHPPKERHDSSATSSADSSAIHSANGSARSSDHAKEKEEVK